MNYDRAKEMWKSLIKANGTVLLGEESYIFDAETVLNAVEKAKTPKDMWESMGVDHSIVVPIMSTATPGTVLNGTRLCLEKLRNVPSGYEFSIRTPVIPARWKTYDEEFTVIWENIINSISKGAQYMRTRLGSRQNPGISFLLCANSLSTEQRSQGCWFFLSLNIWMYLSISIPKSCKLENAIFAGVFDIEKEAA